MPSSLQLRLTPHALPRRDKGTVPKLPDPEAEEPGVVRITSHYAVTACAARLHASFPVFPAVQHAAEEAAALAALGLPTGFAGGRVSTSSHCCTCLDHVVTQAPLRLAAVVPQGGTAQPSASKKKKGAKHAAAAASTSSSSLSSGKCDTRPLQDQRQATPATSAAAGAADVAVEAYPSEQQLLSKDYWQQAYDAGLGYYYYYNEAQQVRRRWEEIWMCDARHPLQ